MASLATACRLSARLAGRRATQDATRGFRTSAASLAAQNFSMPALSPTMTEGNIASWKIKEGDSFAAGDVLLEIETDKASMDVEAQDDGILMKIMQGDGAKAVQVGTRIGVLAEAGDDISQLELPADDSKAAAPKETAKEQPQQQQQQQQQQQPSSQPSEAAPKQKSAGASQGQKSGQKAAPQKYPLYPSVEHLIKSNGLDRSAIAEMTPTGPQGRLLKGDVLVYLGKVAAERPAAIASRFEHNSHLDLSNIKIAKPAAPAPAAKAASPKSPVPQDLQVSLSVSLANAIAVQKKVQESLGTFLPLSVFIARAADLANDDLPLPANYKPTADELFNQVLGLDNVSAKASRGYYLPQIAALPPSSFTGVAPKPKAAAADIIDILAGRSAKKSPARVAPAAPSVSTGINTFSLTVPKGEEKRAQTFLAKMKTVLEQDPGRLVL